MGPAASRTAGLSRERMAPVSSTMRTPSFPGGNLRGTSTPVTSRWRIGSVRCRHREASPAKKCGQATRPTPRSRGSGCCLPRFHERLEGPRRDFRGYLRRSSNRGVSADPKGGHALACLFRGRGESEVARKSVPDEGRMSVSCTLSGQATRLRPRRVRSGLG